MDIHKTYIIIQYKYINLHPQIDIKTLHITIKYHKWSQSIWPKNKWVDIYVLRRFESLESLSWKSNSSSNPTQSMNFDMKTYLHLTRCPTMSYRLFATIIRFQHRNHIQNLPNKLTTLASPRWKSYIDSYDL